MPLNTEARDSHFVKLVADIYKTMKSQKYDLWKYIDEIFIWNSL